MSSIFSTLASLLYIYSILCSIRIVLTWIPGLSNGFTLFLERICDPFLRIFSKKRIFHIGNIDFSPVISLGLLAVISTVFSQLAYTQTIGIGLILSLILAMINNTVLSFAFVIILLLVIRFVIVIKNRSSYTSSQFWSRFDYFVNPLIYKAARLFSGGRMLSYKTSLFIVLLSVVSVSIIFFIFMRIIVFYLSCLPF